MAEKHYTASYLEDTAQILKGIKLKSYEAFSELVSGRIVDIGCGTGIDVANMAQFFEGRLQVTGVDHDASLINIAKENTAHLTHLDFIVSEGSSLPFGSATIAGVRAERLIQHIADPGGVFDEIFRVLDVQSPVVIIESDWNSLCFYDENVEIGKKITAYLTDEKINNGWAPKKLMNYFSASGFVHPQIKVYPFVLTALKDAYTYLWIDKIVREMQQQGILSEVETQSFFKSNELADSKNCFACSMNIVIATAQKP